MAEKRMFTKKIIDSDAFLDMPLSAQALYFHLNMRADDDGFVSNPRRITDYINASMDDLKILLAKRFVISFESGIIVIKHWRMHNTLKADRYHPTDFQEELASLEIKSNKAYTERPVFPQLSAGSKAEPDWKHFGTTDKDKGLDLALEEGLEGKEEDSAVAPTLPPPSPMAPESDKRTERHRYGEYGWVRLTEDEYARLLKDLGEVELTRCITYIDESAQSNGNKNRWKDWNLVVRKCHREQWGVHRGSSQAAGQRPSASAGAVSDLQALHQMFSGDEP